MSTGDNGWTRHRTAVRTLIAVLGSLAFLLGFLWLIGLPAVLAALSGADRPTLLGVVAVGLTAVAVWGVGLRIVLTILSIRVSLGVAITVFLATVFANNVTPFGRLGGDPINGFLVARAVDTDYETGLAAIASTNTLNYVASVLLGFLGIAYLGGSVVFGRGSGVVVGSLLLVSIGTVVSAIVGWRYRHGLADVVTGFLTPIARTVGQFIPGIPRPDRAGVADRIGGFVTALERLVDDPARVGLVFLLALLGQLLVAGSLWLSLAAVGASPPPAVLLVVIPVARLASLLPTPGGLAGVEVALVGLLVSTVGAGAAVVTASVLLYRAATTWLPTVLGAGATAAIVVTR